MIYEKANERWKKEKLEQLRLQKPWKYFFIRPHHEAQQKAAK